MIIQSVMTQQQPKSENDVIDISTKKLQNFMNNTWLK
jgi:hypothetical protein